MLSSTPPEFLPVVQSDDNLPDDELVLSQSLSSRDWLKVEHDDEVVSEELRHIKQDTKSGCIRHYSSPVAKYLQDWNNLDVRDDVLYNRGNVNDMTYL